MLRRIRSAITVVAFLVLCAVSIAGGAVAYLARLPDPEVADQRELFRWLVTRDLTNEAPQTQRKMLHRLESELRDLTPEDLQQVSNEVSAPQQRAQLEKNIDFIAGLWFRQKAEAYADLPRTEQLSFIDHLIGDLQAWAPVVKVLAGGDGKQNRSSLVVLLQRIEQWIEDARPEDQKQMRRFVAAVQARFFVRQFTGGESRRS